MVARQLAALLLALIVLSLSHLVRAGGHEFPGAGTRSLGRGGAAMARADDPNVMLRNPALLADLSGNQATFGAHLLLVDACLQPTGYYGLGVRGSDAVNFGDGPVLLNAPQGSTDESGVALADFATQPYDRVCYQGPAPFLPTIALTAKLSSDFGLGVGFFPPDTTILTQWGNSDGTIDTPAGKRPNPLRFLRSAQQTTLLPLMASAGYRFTDWLALGLSLRWSLIVFNARTWSTESSGLNPSRSIRVEVFGRDLFVPGVTLSTQLSPLENVDVSLGFSWSDRIQTKARLSVTAGAFGAGEFAYITAAGAAASQSGTLPTTTDDVAGEVDAPPLWVPQLAFAVRFADRRVPRSKKRPEAVEPTAKAEVDDAMQTERWDVEFDLVYYLNSFYDVSQFRSDPDTNVSLRAVENGAKHLQTVQVGRCPVPRSGPRCPELHVTDTTFGGQDQLTMRLGADYNLLPGKLALRAGASYESDGVDPEMLHPIFYMLGRIGLHAGFTWRISKRTDFSGAFAYFVQRSVRLKPNPGSRYIPKYQGPEFNYPQDGDKVDGVAQLPVPSSGDGTVGYINAGTYHYNLAVISASLTQHF